MHKRSKLLLLIPWLRYSIMALSCQSPKNVTQEQHVWKGLCRKTNLFKHSFLYSVWDWVMIISFTDWKDCSEEEKVRRRVGVGKGEATRKGWRDRGMRTGSHSSDAVTCRHFCQRLILNLEIHETKLSAMITGEQGSTTDSCGKRQICEH